MLRHSVGLDELLLPLTRSDLVHAVINDTVLMTAPDL